MRKGLLNLRYSPSLVQKRTLSSSATFSQANKAKNTECPHVLAAIETLTKVATAIPKKKANVAFLGMDMLTDKRRQIILKKNGVQFDKDCGQVYHDGEVDELMNPSKLIPVPRAAFQRDVLDNEEVDAVFVGSEMETKAADIRKCFEAGKHVFAEFPISFDKTDISELLKSAQKNNVLLQIGNGKRTDDDLSMARNRFREVHATVDELRMFSKEPRRYPDWVEMGSPKQLELTVKEFMASDIDYLLHILGEVNQIDVSEVCMGDLGVDVTLKIGSVPLNSAFTCKFTYRLDFLGYVHKFIWNDMTIIRNECHSWNTVPWVDSFRLGTIVETEYFKDLVLSVKNHPGDEEVREQRALLERDGNIAMTVVQVVDKILAFEGVGPLPEPPVAPKLVPPVSISSS